MKIFEVFFSSWAGFALVVLIFLWKPIAGLIARLSRIEFPGGSMETQPPSISIEEPPAESKVLEVDSSKHALKSDEPKLMETEPQEQKEEKTYTQEDINRLQTWIRAWKFEFLNVFLVPNTKNVLFYFLNEIPYTREHVETMWSRVITNPNELQTILKVLLDYNLLKEEEGKLRITQEGIQFLYFIETVKGFMLVTLADLEKFEKIMKKATKSSPSVDWKFPSFGGYRSPGMKIPTAGLRRTSKQKKPKNTSP